MWPEHSEPVRPGEVGRVRYDECEGLGASPAAVHWVSLDLGPVLRLEMRKYTFYDDEWVVHFYLKSSVKNRNNSKIHFLWKTIFFNKYALYGNKVGNPLV